jgi:hypothetical protein
MNASYTVLRGCWCNITVLKVNAPSVEKSDDPKTIFMKIYEQDFDYFPVPNKNVVMTF